MKNKNKYRSTWTARGPRQRHPQKFFQGVSSEISFIYWINQNLAAAITILLRDLNQKLKRSCSKNVAMRAACFANWCNSSVLWMGVRGRGPQSLGNFRNFLKKITTLTPFGSHFERFLKPLKRIKLLRLRIYLKFLNCPAISARIICRSNSNYV